MLCASVQKENFFLQTVHKEAVSSIVRNFILGCTNRYSSDHNCTRVGGYLSQVPDEYLSELTEVDMFFRIG